MNQLYQDAIKSIESSGGDYGALGPVTSSGDRAYGAYQVMGSNIPDWTEKHYGQSLTPDEFVKNKEAQDAVFNGEFGSYVDKYGNPQDAASMWFSGKPLAKAGNASDGYITTPAYVSKFNKYVAANGDGVSAINNAAGVSPAAPGALSFAKTGDDGEDKPALSANAVVGPGALSASPAAADTSGTDWGDWGRRLTGAAAGIASISNPEQAKVLAAQAAAMQKQQVDQGTYEYKVLPDGRMMLTNSKDPRKTMLLPGNYAKPDDPGGDEYKKLEAKSAKERYDSVTTADHSADDQLALLQKLRTSVNNPNLYFGPGGDQVAQAKALASNMGIKTDGVDDSQIVQRLATQMQLSKGKMLPGAISNYEDQLMSRANGFGLDKTKGANLDAIDAQEAILKHQKAAAKEAYKYVQSNGMLDDKWEPYVSDWATKNQLVLPQAPAAASPAMPQLPKGVRSIQIIQ